MPKKYAISAVVVVVLVLGFVLLNQSGRNPKPTPPTNPVLDSNPAVVNTASPEANPSPTATIFFSDSGFSPNTLPIQKGDTVTFKNMSSSDFWPASNPHPTHTDYPGFDAKSRIPPGGQYQFQFTRTGSWGYHDHLNPKFTGKITVQ